MSAFRTCTIPLRSRLCNTLKRPVYLSRNREGAVPL